MIQACRKIANSVRYAVKGFLHAYRKDESFRLELRVGLPVYLVLGYLFFPFQAWELALFVFSYLFILTVELVNTAFETMLDKLHPEQHETIGRSKDISATAVLMAFMFAILVIGILAWERIPTGETVRFVQYFA
jgi:diacylglycerol kinase (ATP)